MTLDVTAFTGLGPGIHDVVVTNIEKKVAKAGGEYLRWEFSDRDGKNTSAASSVEMTPGNKTGKWFASLTGKPTVVGEQRQMTEVIGRPCTIVVELNAEGFPKIAALTARQATAHSPVRPLQEPPADTGAADFAAEESDQLPF